MEETALSSIKATLSGGRLGQVLIEWPDRATT
jgi:hypothetical protein